MGRSVPVGFTFSKSVDGNRSCVATEESAYVRTYSFTGSKMGGKYGGQLALARGTLIIGTDALDGVVGDRSRGFVEIKDLATGSSQSFQGSDYEQLGVSLGISEDGKTASAGHRSGVRIFSLVDGNWKITAEVVPDLQIDMSIAPRITMSKDGRTIALGLPFFDNPDDGTLQSVGAVVVYRLQGDHGSNTWKKVGRALIGEKINQQLGISISLSLEGEIMTVASAIPIYRKGSVQRYEFNGVAWEPTGQLLFGEDRGDAFGWSHSLSSDGTALVVGAQQLQSGKESPGYVKVYRYHGSEWFQTGKRLDGDSTSMFGNSFGKNVDIAVLGNGNLRIVVGDPSYQNGQVPVRGLVRVYESTGGVNDDFNQISEDIVGDVEQQALGEAVVISSDGCQIAMGGPVFGVSNIAKVVYVYELQ